MPTIPLVNAPMPQASTGGAVRADVHMYDQVYAAGQRVGGAIAGIGEQTGDLAARVKHATDTAYLLQSQTKMDAATRDFQTWAETHPDTSGWDDEWKARKQAVVESVQSGANNLGQQAKLHLETTLNDWHVRTGSLLNQAKTEQNIRNAAGTAEEALQDAVVTNDTGAVKAVIDTAVSQGVWSAPLGVAKLKRAMNGISTNVANAQMNADPFGFDKWIDEKDASGNYVNLPHLPEQGRVLARIRAAKLANETRSQTMRTWAENMRGAIDGTQPMPDRDAINAEAAHQGISPRWVANLFAWPERIQKKEAAEQAKADAQALTDDINNYDPIADEKGEQFHKLTERATLLPMQYSGRLMQTLDRVRKQGMKDPTDDGMKAIADMRAAGVFDPKDPASMSSHAKAWEMQEELRAFRKENPNATHKEERAFIEAKTRQAVIGAATAAISNTDKPAFSAGERRRQNGVVYEFDGKNWNEVK